MYPVWHADRNSGKEIMDSGNCFLSSFDATLPLTAKMAKRERGRGERAPRKWGERMEGLKKKRSCIFRVKSSRKQFVKEGRTSNERRGVEQTESDRAIKREEARGERETAMSMARNVND